MPSAFFNPSPEDTDRVLHRFADHEVSFHDIADEFKTTVPALVLWLSKPEIAQRITDLRSAGAERTRTIAALYLPRTIPVLMRIIDSHDHDIGHRLDDPRDPATPILKLRERESVRKAITLIYRLANFTDKPAPARAASPVASTSSRCRETSESPTPRAIEVAALSDFDANSRTAVPYAVAPASNRSPEPHLTTGNSTGGGTGVGGPPVHSDSNPSLALTSDLTISPALAPLRGAEINQPSLPVGVAFATTHGYSLPPLRGEDSEFGSRCPAPSVARGVLSNAAPPHPNHESRMPTAECLPPNHQSPLTDHFFDPLSISSSSTSLSPPSRSNPNTASALLERAGSAPRRSRAGPLRQSA